MGRIIEKPGMDKGLLLEALKSVLRPMFEEMNWGYSLVTTPEGDGIEIAERLTVKVMRGKMNPEDIGVPSFFGMFVDAIITDYYEISAYCGDCGEYHAISNGVAVRQTAYQIGMLLASQGLSRFVQDLPPQPAEETAMEHQTEPQDITDRKQDNGEGMPEDDINDSPFGGNSDGFAFGGGVMMIYRRPVNPDDNTL